MIRKKPMIFILVLLVVLIGLFLVFKNAGSYLVKTATPNKADAIVLLMGSIPDRVLQTADLYKQGLAPQILIVEEEMNTLNLLNKRGASVLSNTTQCRNALVQLGIPADSIIILAGDARSTQQEALIIREYLKAHKAIDTITLVTSADHSRRADMIFKKAFKKEGIVIQCSASKYTGYTGEGWWKNKEGIQTVLMEYLKMGNFWLFEKRKL